MRVAESSSPRVLGVMLCGALDATLAFWLVTDRPSATNVLATLIAHLLISLAGGFALAGLMPPFVRASRRAAIGTCALIATFIPAIGVVGMFLAIRYGLTEPRPLSREPWVVFDAGHAADESPHAPRRARRRGASAVDIRATLRQRSADTVALRFQAVLAIQKLPPKVGVPLLKVAQSDPADEVRLYAFSRLERMRDGLEKQVKELLGFLEAAGQQQEEGARLHLRLAHSYFELGYLGLAEGAVLDHALRSAHRHAAIACELMPNNAPAEFFLGRVLIQLRDPDRAAIAFGRAIGAGYPRVKLLPWLAECSFYERDFESVRGLLRELESASPENVFFQAVSDFWAAPHSDRPPPPPGSRTSLQIGSDRSLARARQP